MSVSLLKDKFGWEFFEKLKSNKAKVGKGTGTELSMILHQVIC